MNLKNAGGRSHRLTQDEEKELTPNGPVRTTGARLWAGKLQAPWRQPAGTAMHFGNCTCRPIHRVQKTGCSACGPIFGVPPTRCNTYRPTFGTSQPRAAPAGQFSESRNPAQHEQPDVKRRGSLMHNVRADLWSLGSPMHDVRASVTSLNTRCTTFRAILGRFFRAVFTCNRFHCSALQPKPRKVN